MLALIPLIESRRVGVGVYVQNAAQIDILNGLWLGGASQGVLHA